MIKNLQSLVLAFLLMIVSVAAFAANDSVEVKDHGAYLLDGYYHDDKGHNKVLSLAASQHVTINPQHNSSIYLWAEGGRSTTLRSNNNGIIKCTGTTIIGFKCKYE